MPYKGGGQAITDLLGGQVQLASLGSSPLIPHYRAGKVKLLAQSTRVRVSGLEQVPTYEQAGIKNLVVEQWLGVFLPAGTPKEILTRLNTEIVKALSDPTIRANYLQAALEPVGNTPEQFTKVVRDDYERYGLLLRDLTIKLD